MNFEFHYAFKVRDLVSTRKFHIDWAVGRVIITRQLLNFKSDIVPVSMLKLIICVFSLFYLISCGSNDSATSPSSDSSLSLVRSLTLEEVTEDSITVSWDLLRTGDSIDFTIEYTVYVETNDGGSGEVFEGDGTGEREYISVDDLPLDDVTRTRITGVTVSDLANNTPYRIVVEAKDSSGAISQSRLLAYTASEWGGNDVVSGLDAETILDESEVTVIWDANDGAQGYAIKARKVNPGGLENGLVENTEDGDESGIIAVVCSPDSLLCNGNDKAELDDKDKLTYKIEIATGVRYDLVVVPFNFGDLKGLQAIDENGKVKTFIGEVLAQIKDEGSELSRRLEDALDDSTKFDLMVPLSEVGPPSNLVLTSMINAVSATWEHGNGAEYYHAILSSEGMNPVTNTTDRSTRQRSTTFWNLITNTTYTVTVQSLTVIAGKIKVGRSVSNTITITSEEPEKPAKVTSQDLTLTNYKAGGLRVTWNTPESNSVIGYRVFYWTGDSPPAEPQRTLGRGTTTIDFTVDPGIYKVRVDVLSSYVNQGVVIGKVTGDPTSPIMIYGNPFTPADLGVDFSQGRFTNIGDNLYAIRYPLTYTGASNDTEAGGPLSDVSYQYRYRIAGGAWEPYNKISVNAPSVIDLLVNDWSDADKIKGGYGKKYQVQLIASNEGGFFSDEKDATHEFAYQSFPEPFNHSELKVTVGNQRLEVAWPEVTEKNGSTVSSYIVLLTDRSGSQVRSNYTSDRNTVFDGLINGQQYSITVIPNGLATGNLLTALSRVTDYTYGGAITGDAYRILTAYTGPRVFYTPELPLGAPEAVVNLLAVTAGDDQATVTWDASATGIAATGYQLQYLTNITASLEHINQSDGADNELSKLSWVGATTVEVAADNSGSYSRTITLDVSVVNAFRVRAVVIDAAGKEWLGIYRYYALKSQIGKVRNLKATDFKFYQETRTGGFRVSWDAPAEGTAIGYEVAYKSYSSSDYQSVDHTGIETQYVFDNFNPGRPYEIQVSAKAYGGITGAKTSIIKYTPSPPASVPNAITFANITASTVRIQWKHTLWRGTDGNASDSYLNSDIVSYKVDIKEKVGTTWSNVVDNYSDFDVDSQKHETATVTASNLTKSTSYVVRIIAKNNWGDSKPTISNVTTGELDPIPPTAVNGLKVTSSTYNTVALSWNAPSDPGKIDKDKPDKATITSYIVKYKTPGMSDFIEMEIDENSSDEKVHSLTRSTATVTNLKVETEYTFSVVAVHSGNGVGPDPEVKPTHHFKLAVPVLREAACVTTTKVSLAWDPSPGATSYKFYRGTDTKIDILSGTSYSSGDHTPGTAYTYKVQACSAEGKCSAEFGTLTITTLAKENLFKRIIDDGEIPADFADYGRMPREIFSHYKVGARLVARYLKPSSQGSGEFYNDPAGNLNTVLSKITDATTNKVYVVFVTGGTYTLNSTSSKIAMKNHIAIVGGVDGCLEPSKMPTELDGKVEYQVFNNNNNGLDNTALLYGMTVIKGRSVNGGGMYNFSSSPSLVRVIFSRNSATHFGGGMHNWDSSPSLAGVTFSGNGAKWGGGMANTTSSPSLAGVTFSGNRATHGGGMYNNQSFPSLVNVTLSGNTADYGGGMNNYRDSFPILVGVTFSGNKARWFGGGIYNDNASFNHREESPLIVNSIFWGNTATFGPQFYFKNDYYGRENLGIYNSIMQGGTGNLVSGKSYTSANQGGFSSAEGSAPIVISFSDITNADPELDELADNGGMVWTHTITKTSSAVNHGLYVKKKGSTFYYSVNYRDWYTRPDLTGTTSALPTDAEDLTAIDATGHVRGRPDLGAYEYRDTAE